jgi:hypothetical protein
MYVGDTRDGHRGVFRQRIRCRNSLDPSVATRDGRADVLVLAIDGTYRRAGRGRTNEHLDPDVDHVDHDDHDDHDALTSGHL